MIITYEFPSGIHFYVNPYGYPNKNPDANIYILDYIADPMLQNHNSERTETLQYRFGNKPQKTSENYLS